MRQSAIYCFAFIAVICTTSSALCQDGEPTAESGNDNVAKAESDNEKSTEPSSRFRWGISLGGGPLMGGYSGGAGGIDARFGWQFNSLFGLYAQPVLLLGAGASADMEGASATGLAMYGVGVLPDITLANFLYLALGPELLLGAIGEAEITTTSGTAAGDTGPFFSIAARAGFAFGSTGPTGRKAFAIGLDMHVLFANEVAIMPMIFLGFESF